MLQNRFFTAIATALFLTLAFAGQSTAQSSLPLEYEGKMTVKYKKNKHDDGSFRPGQKDTLRYLYSHGYPVWIQPGYSSEQYQNVPNLDVSDEKNQELGNDRGKYLDDHYFYGMATVLDPQNIGRVSHIYWGKNPNAPELAGIDILEPVYIADEQQPNYEPSITLAVDRFSWGPSFSARLLVPLDQNSDPISVYIFTGGFYLRFGENIPIRVGGEVGGKNDDYNRASKYAWFAYANAASTPHSKMQKGKLALLLQVSGGQEFDKSLVAQRSHAEFSWGFSKKVGPVQASWLLGLGGSWFLDETVKTSAITGINLSF